MNRKPSKTLDLYKIVLAFWIALFVVIHPCWATTSAVGTRERVASIASNNPRRPWRKHRIRISDNALVNRTSSTAHTSFIQIIETEYFDETTGTWCAFGSNRTENDNDENGRADAFSNDENSANTPQWTDAISGDTVRAPAEYELPPHQEWVGEWNICLTSQSSAHGWEYSRRRRRRQASPLLRYTCRRRVWLRPVVTTASPRTRKPRFYAPVLQAIRDDWSFKGFGITLTKSAVFRNAFGVAFRLPLTLNFGTWERHPVLPNLSSSVAVFLPQLCLCLFLNLSVRIEYLQRALYYLAHIIPSLCTAVLLLLLRGLALAVSALLYPFTRNPLLLSTSTFGNTEYRNKNSLVLSTLLASQQNSLRRRRRQSDERIDVTCAWRWSVERGYEFRVFFSHWYVVDLATLIQTNMPRVPPHLSTTASIVKLLDWIPKHAAAVGWCFTGPVHQDNSDLLVTASALLSLSGFYLTEPSPSASKSLSRPLGTRKANHHHASSKQQIVTEKEDRSVPRLKDMEKDNASDGSIRTKPKVISL